MIEYWHNPRCSKSRAGLEMLQKRDVEVSVRRYLNDAPDEERIKAVWQALGEPPVIDMMRPGEKLFRELGLDKTTKDDTLFAAMAEHPILIERPIAISGTRAVIGRPTEAILDLL